VIPANAPSLPLAGGLARCLFDRPALGVRIPALAQILDQQAIDKIGERALILGSRALSEPLKLGAHSKIYLLGLEARQSLHFLMLEAAPRNVKTKVLTRRQRHAHLGDTGCVRPAGLGGRGRGCE
jgi:hypothetical protein